MKKNHNFFILVGINVVLSMLIIFSVIFLVQNNQNNVVNAKDTESLQTVKQKLGDFIDEHKIQYRPSSLDQYQGPIATGIPILMYHDVVPEKLAEYDGNKLYVEDFRQHVIYLAENGYRTLTVEEFDKFYRGEIEVPEKSILMTFDDGFRSVKELIEPILQEYNMHAVSFIIGEKTVNEPMWFITPEEIKELQERNFVEFQSHSYSLHNAGGNGRGMIETIDTEGMLEDVRKENKLIGTTEIFCYPFGHADGVATSMLQAGDIKYGVTTAYGYATRDTNALVLPRIRINANTSVEDFASLITY